MKRGRSTSHFVLQEFLPYLTNRVGVKTGLVFAQDLRDFGLTLFEWRILIALWGNEEVRLNDIADILLADLSTTSRQVRGLERAGMLARARSVSDRRALSLVLTAKGRNLTARIIPISRMHERVATEGLEPADLTTLRRVLLKIFNNLNAFEESRESLDSAGAES